MAKTIYSEPGIEALEDGQILLMRCPRCKRENYALEVISGYCVWCGYNTHKDEELKKKIADHAFDRTLQENKDILNKIKEYGD